MSSQVEISIPTTSKSSSTKPYTIYNVSVRLPLRSFTLQKRYSEFVELHRCLATQAGTTPPFPLPPKSYFRSTISDPALAEDRRKKLEIYLNSINSTEDARWRSTGAWRAFLNLPTTTTSRSSTATNLHLAIAGSGAPITDPVVWLDQHRNLKAELHEARVFITRRDQASTAQSQHEAAAQAKKCLVRSGTMMSSLDNGLKSLGTGRTGGKLGEGELRKRRDMLANAGREKEGLESLLSAMAAKTALDRTIASAQDRGQLTGHLKQNGSAHSSQPSTGRVLGKETDKTRALDNQGVLQLQQQLMQEQDEDVTVLARAVTRQKELGIRIQEELAVQTDMLNLLDEDVDRVQGKIDVARKRVNKIS